MQQKNDPNIHEARCRAASLVKIVIIKTNEVIRVNFLFYRICKLYFCFSQLQIVIEFAQQKISIVDKAIGTMGQEQTKQEQEYIQTSNRLFQELQEKIVKESIKQISLNKSKRPTKPIIYKKKEFVSDQHIISIPMDQQGSLKGIDRRQLVNDMVYPYTAIGKIQAIFGYMKHNQRGFGTGSLIYDKIVLTCAHIVFNKSENCFANQLFFYPGLNDKKNRSFEACLAFVPYQYIFLQDPQQYKPFDFAILILYANSLADQYGYFAVSDKNIEKTQQVQVFGYPMVNKNTNFMYGCTGLIEGFDDKKIYHLASTSAGQSGSPILRRTKQGYQIIGIHVAGGAYRNHGIRLRYQILSRINKWLQDLEIQNPQRKIFIPKQFLNINIIKDDRVAPHKYVQGMQQAIDLEYDQKFNRINDPSQLLQIAKYLLDSGRDTNKAARYLQKGLRICQQLHLEQRQIFESILECLGQAQMFRGNLDASLSCHTLAYQIAEKNQKLAKQSLNLNSIAMIKQARGQYEQALQIYDKRIQLLKQMKQKQNICDLSVLVANKIQLLTKLDRLTEALQNCQILQRLLIALDQQQNIIHMYFKFCLGMVYLKQNKTQKAKKQFDQCKAYFSKHKILDCNYSFLYNSMGQLELQRGNFDQAIKCFTEALDVLYKKYGHKNFYCAKILANLGNVEYILDKFEAFDHLQASKNIFERFLTKDNRNIDYIFLIKTLESIEKNNTFQ